MSKINFNGKLNTTIWTTESKKVPYEFTIKLASAQELASKIHSQQSPLNLELFWQNLNNRFEQLYQNFDFSKTDKTKWEQGAKQFNEFWASLSTTNKDLIDPYDRDLLRALFMGEKPCTILAKSSILPSKNKLEEFGFTIEGDETNSLIFVYKDKAIQEVIKNHEDIFTNNESSYNLVKRLCKGMKESTLTDDDHFKIGLILGFPKEACEEHKDISKLRHYCRSELSNIDLADLWDGKNIEQKLKEISNTPTKQRSGLIKLLKLCEKAAKNQLSLSQNKLSLFCIPAYVWNQSKNLGDESQIKLMNLLGAFKEVNFCNSTLTLYEKTRLNACINDCKNDAKRILDFQSAVNILKQK